MFPKRCVFCNSVIGFEANCSECDANGGTAELALSGELKAEEYELGYIDSGAACFKYSGIIKGAVQDCKYNGQLYKTEEFAKIMLKKYYECFGDKGIDVITYVPYFKEEKRKRHYYIPQLLARQLSHKLGIIFTEDAVSKDFNTKPQHTLSKNERKNNLLGVFSCKESFIVDKKVILLIDDVITTGTTVNTVAEVLKISGAKKVYVLCLATALINKEDENGN